MFTVSQLNQFTLMAWSCLSKSGYSSFLFLASSFKPHVSGAAFIWLIDMMKWKQKPFTSRRHLFFFSSYFYQDQCQLHGCVPVQLVAQGPTFKRATGLVGSCIWFNALLSQSWNNYFLRGTCIFILYWAQYTYYVPSELTDWHSDIIQAKAKST